MALVGTNVSQEHVVSIIKIERISKLGISLELTKFYFPYSLRIPSKLMTEAIRSLETSVLTRTKRGNFLADGILDIMKFCITRDDGRNG
jgi:hypothetical protein